MIVFDRPSCSYSSFRPFVILCIISFTASSGLAQRPSRASSSAAIVNAQCSITVNQLAVLKRKLTYQLWDSIEEPAPDLYLRIKAKKKIIMNIMYCTCIR